MTPAARRAWILDNALADAAARGIIHRHYREPWPPDANEWTRRHVAPPRREAPVEPEEIAIPAERPESVIGCCDGCRERQLAEPLSLLLPWVGERTLPMYRMRPVDVAWRDEQAEHRATVYLGQCPRCHTIRWAMAE